MVNKQCHVTYRLHVPSLKDWPMVYDSKLGQKVIDGRKGVQIKGKKNWISYLRKCEKATTTYERRETKRGEKACGGGWGWGGGECKGLTSRGRRGGR